MAEETLEEEEEDDKEIISPETIIEWERIQFPLDHNQSPLPAPDPSNTAWSMVPDDPHPQIVFPPVNHEGLQISSNHDVRDINLDRVVQPSPLHSPRHRHPWGIDSAAWGWWDVGLELLRFKFSGIVSWLRNFAAARGLPTLFRSRGYAATLAGSMMLLLLYLRFRRRRQLRRESLLDLVRLIKQKDEEILQKISVLLQQIERMNEIVLASQQGVAAIPLPRTA